MRSAPKQLNVMGIMLASAKSVFSSMALKRFSRRTCLAVLLLSCHCVHGEDQHWLRVSSDHFLVLTDAGAKKGHEIVARFEQMRAVFAQLLGRKKLVMAKPLEIILIANPTAYAQLAP